jgi:hypothetical protein
MVIRRMAPKIKIRFLSDSGYQLNPTLICFHRNKMAANVMKSRERRIMENLTPVRF